MLFEIRNIGKIQNASLELRGITVIAGNNNTGKSTYGKILYCMFNAFYNAGAAIYKERKSNIKDIVYPSFLRFDHRQVEKLINTIMGQRFSAEEIRKLLKEATSNKDMEIRYRNKNEDTIIDDMVEKIMRSGEVADEQIQKTLLTRFLKSEFGNQIIHVNHAEEPGAISLTIRGNMLSASIEHNECADFTDNVGVTHKALYIDTPFVLDELTRYSRHGGIGHRDRLLESLAKSFEDVSVVDEILAKQQLQRILSAISSVVGGEFRKIKGDWMFQAEGLNGPVGVFNVSAGMKPFLILKRLLEAGEIKEHDILVFDEPEIHLHPEWQLKYAELLVLLQKEFDLHILLTTHSPYFFNAIEVYSQRNGISGQCNYYLSDTHDDVYAIKEVTENLDMAYQKMAKPFQELENLRYRED